MVLTVRGTPRKWKFGEQVSERRTGGAMSEVGCVDSDDRLEVTRAERVVIFSAKIGQMEMGSR